jgi:Fe-S-cluster containining protein
MNLREKSQEVRVLFDELDQEIKAFLDQSQLGCIAGCGRCCANPKVSASILEFLPLAFDLYEKGKAESALELLENSSENDFCIVYKSLSADGESGFCSDYMNRGLICRLFGSSARVNRLGEREIITCKKIKTEKADLYQHAALEIKKDMPVPSSSGTYRRLNNIDSRLAEDQMPINQAIRAALEKVMDYMYYFENQEPEAAENF